MSMKGMADAAIEDVNKRLSAYGDSRFPTGDEVQMGAMVCRIRELEQALSSVLNCPWRDGTENQKKLFKESRKLL